MKCFIKLSVLALAYVIGCGSGGTGDVVLVGDGAEDPGPRNPGLTGYVTIRPGPVGTSVSPFNALCRKACVHLRSANCSPTLKAANCDTECAQYASVQSGGLGGMTSGLTKIPETCMDQAAALFHCQAVSPVTCSQNGSPTVACDTEARELRECQSPSATSIPDGCVRESQHDSACQGLSVLYYYVCKYYAPSKCSPALSPVEGETNGYCCP